MITNFKIFEGRQSIFDVFSNRFLYFITEVFPNLSCQMTSIDQYYSASFMKTEAKSSIEVNTYKVNKDFCCKLPPHYPKLTKTLGDGFPDGEGPFKNIMIDFESWDVSLDSEACILIEYLKSLKNFIPDENNEDHYGRLYILEENIEAAIKDFDIEKFKKFRITNRFDL